MTTRLLFVHALSPLHAGTGHAIGAVDLPIARDRATSHPILPGSTIKGCLRDAAEGEPWTVGVFGPDTKNASEHSGSAVFGDANLLLLPVRSIYGTFAWVTCPLALERYRRDAAGTVAKEKIPKTTSIGKPAQVAITKTSVLKGTARVVFEDLDFEVASDAADMATGWASHLGESLFAAAESTWRESFQSRFCIVPDDVFTHLAENATDIVTRVSIDKDSKTVRPGQLWTEESLPTESVLVSLVFVRPPVKSGMKAATVVDHLQSLTTRPVQFGGKATVGRGRCRLVLAGG
jgi:CRISPR-associated protein Cmr4